MARYLLVRIGSLIVSIIVATLAIFLIMHAIPGGPSTPRNRPSLPISRPPSCASMAWISRCRFSI
jgi:ABC-type dipeptide/oligopeptide/nickel transport system permease component